MHILLLISDNVNFGILIVLSDFILCIDQQNLNKKLLFLGNLNATALHWAVRQGHLDTVILLMKYGADPSIRDSEGCSCLHLASQFGHTSIVAYLISKGQDVDMVDGNGMTLFLFLWCGTCV